MILSRRSVLALGGLAGLGAVGAVGEGAGWFRGSSAAPRATVQRWRADRGDHYVVAHRGSGDVLPEHTLPAYRAARDWGARAMEVSVARTSDGVLVCMHDLTYDRTTNLRGAIAAQPSSVLADARVVQPQLGPAWTAPPLLPRVPRLEEVLAEFGGTVMLCLEAKDDAAYEPMMAMVEARGLRDGVVVKAYRSSRRIEQARAAGYPLFAYLGPDDLSPAATAALAARLRPDLDHLGLPTAARAGSVPDDVVRDCVSHGIPVWAYPVHRRSEAARLFGLGVAGVVASSYGYVSGVTAPLASDTWASRRVAPGEMSRSPGDPAAAPAWTGRDELSLDHGAVQFVTLRQCSPLPRASRTYVLDVQVRWPGAHDATAEVSLVVGHADDRHYEPGQVGRKGYDAVLAGDGRLELRRHGGGAPTVLGSVTTAAPADGQWVPLRLTVTPDALRWTRPDSPGASVDVQDRSVRGGYVHLGRVGPAASFRGLRVG